MSENLNGLLASTRTLFENGPTLVDRDPDGHDVLVVVDLSEAAWRIVRAFIAEGGWPSDLSRELGELSLERPNGMVTALVQKIRGETKIVDPGDLLALAETVTYLVTTLRRDPEIEIEEFDRWALSIKLNPDQF